MDNGKRISERIENKKDGISYVRTFFETISMNELTYAQRKDIGIKLQELVAEVLDEI